MADKGGSAGCDQTCGCPSPCPGGSACKCATRSETSGGGDMEHMRCSCGDHCGCNPCTCQTTQVSGVGKAHCKCGEGCTCVSCAA